MNPRFRVPSRPYLQQNFLDMVFSDCTPNKLFRNREAGLTFATFTERMFNKLKSFFKLSAGKLQFRFVPYESYIITKILG